MFPFGLQRACDGPGEGVPLCAVSAYAWYAAEATQFMQGKGWEVTGNVKKEQVPNPKP